MVMQVIVFGNKKYLAFVFLKKYPDLYHNLVFPYLIKHTSSSKKIGYVFKVLFPHLKVLKSLTFWSLLTFVLKKISIYKTWIFYKILM
jgi:hypothetical protein